VIVTLKAACIRPFFTPHDVPFFLPDARWSIIDCNGRLYAPGNGPAPISCISVNNGPVKKYGRLQAVLSSAGAGVTTTTL
jgi:hypothetical protein